MKQTIVIDFDGVLHSYTSGWEGSSIIRDQPTHGAKEAINALREKYIVVVCSSRCHQPGGIEAIKAWLAHHEIEVDSVQNDKPPHIVVVDDRALRFEGDWSVILQGIKAAAIPWNKKGKEVQP